MSYKSLTHVIYLGNDLVCTPKISLFSTYIGLIFRASVIIYARTTHGNNPYFFFNPRARDLSEMEAVLFRIAGSENVYATLSALNVFRARAYGSFFVIIAIKIANPINTTAA